jgi:hypothetical protein
MESKPKARRTAAAGPWPGLQQFHRPFETSHGKIPANSGQLGNCNVRSAASHENKVKAPG